MTGMNSPSQVKIVIAFLAIYLIWGTTFLGIRFAVETIPAFMMAGLRFFSAGGVMMVILLVQGGRFPTLRQWRSAVIVGGLMLVGGIGLVSFAEERISSGVAALVVATIPVWITLFAWIGFGSKKPNAQTFTGLGLGFLGTILLFAPTIDTDNDQLAGMGIVFIGTMLFATGSLYSRRAPLPKDTRMSTASEMLAAGIMLMGVSLLSGEPSRLDVGSISLRSILALIYLTIFGSIIGYTAYLWLLKTVEPTKVSTNFYVNPVIAVLMGWLVADEDVTLFMIIATIVILLGVAVINIKLPPIGQKRRHAIKHVSNE